MAPLSFRRAVRRPPNLGKRSFALSGHRTSVALEPEFWSMLEGIARRRACTLSALVAEVDARREAGRPLASALRVHVIFELSERAGQSRQEEFVLSQK